MLSNQIHPWQTETSRSPTAPVGDEEAAPPPYPTDAAINPTPSFPVAPATGENFHPTGGGQGTSMAPDQSSATLPSYEARPPAGHKTHPSYPMTAMNSNGQLLTPHHQYYHHYPPPPPAYGVLPPLHQHQSVTIVGHTPQVYHPSELESESANYGCAVVLSCCVFWCCGCIFGLIAFILAVNASNTAPTSPKRARKLVVASYVISGIGIAVPILAVVIAASILGSRDKPIMSCSAPFIYTVDGKCYKYRIQFESRHLCRDYLDGYSTKSYCYFNNNYSRLPHAAGPYRR